MRWTSNNFHNFSPIHVFSNLKINFSVYSDNFLRMYYSKLNFLVKIRSSALNMLGVRCPLDIQVRKLRRQMDIMCLLTILLAILSHLSFQINFTYIFLVCHKKCSEILTAIIFNFKS